MDASWGELIRVLLLSLGAIALLLLGIEAGLRTLGLHQPICYVADAAAGYRLTPHQRRYRRGKRFETNAVSMRSAEVQIQRPADTLRILLLGDSVANGGLAIDQTETISAVLQQQLTAQATAQTSNQATPPLESIPPADVLNASTSSWGPQNEWGYLRTFGTFDAQIVLLLLNTDDLFAGAPTSHPVGSYAYPTHPPKWAIARLWHRWQHQPPAQTRCSDPASDPVAENLRTLHNIRQFTQAKNATLILVLTPLRRELEQNEQRDYEHQARIQLSTFVEANHITWIDFLNTWKNDPDANRFYRDSIHLSVDGNNSVSTAIASLISTIL